MTQLFLNLVVILCLAYGFISLISPSAEKKLTPKLIKTLPYWGWGLIFLALSIILFFSASIASVPFFVRFISTIILIKALMVTFTSKENTLKAVDWWAGSPAHVVRFAGIFYLVVGFFLLFIVNY